MMNNIKHLVYKNRNNLTLVIGQQKAYMTMYISQKGQECLTYPEAVL